MSGPSTSPARAGPSTSQPLAGPSTSGPQAGPSSPRVLSSPPLSPKRRKKQRQKESRAVKRHEAASVLDSSIQAQICKPVETIPGIVSCPELSQWNLAVATDWNLLCCTKCNQADRIVDFNTVREHIKKHVQDLDPRVTTAHIKAVCRKYQVIELEPRLVPRPLPGLAPLEVLQTFKVWKCTICEDRDVARYMASDTSRRRHHSEVHKNMDAPHTYEDRVVDAQTFCRKDATNKTWFEVDPDLLRVRKLDLDHGVDLNLPREATAQEMARAYRSIATPSEPAPVQVDELRDVMPLLHITGYAQHVGNRTEELRPLVHSTGSRDPHAFIYNAAVELWEKDQARIISLLDPVKEALLDDESGKPAGMFAPLSTSTSESYGQLWGRWCMFICRLREMMLDPDNNSYPVTMTEEQAKWADQARAYCVKNSPNRRYHSHEILYRMSAAFWRPMHEGYYDALVEDKFSDPTVRFACLINIRESGEFSTPSNICHELVRMKYVMRQVLYFWSVNDHKVTGRPMRDAIKAISHSISRRRVSPFSIICSWASHASSYTHTTVALPSVVWTGEESLSVHGYQVSVPHLGARIAAEIRALQTLIYEHLLLNLSPESLGFDITETTQIPDNLGETGIKDSMWNAECLDKLRTKLGEAFGTHPQAEFMMNRVGVTEDAEKMFKYDGCAKWLQIVNLVNRKIMLLLHMTGGQSGRGAELVGIRYLNSAYRRRSLYMIAPGLMAMLMFYSKMTSQTGKDRVIGHAVPWSLARLILIHRALVLPLASAIKKAMSAPNQKHLAANMLSLVCTVNGEPVKADLIGGDLQNWFLLMCGHAIRWRTFRHLQIAISRKLMPGAYRTIQRVLNILDAQAGHSSEVADEHYAVKGSKEWVIEHDTLYKYVVVSSWWWRIIFKNDPDMLTERESRIGRQAETELPRIDSLDPAELPHSMPELLQSLSSLASQLTGIAADVREVRDLLLNWQTRVTTDVDQALREGTHQAPRSNPVSTRASREPVRARHLFALQLFCDHYALTADRVVWTSPEQAQALIHTLERLHSLLIVLPTGGGKSMIFGAMPYQHQGVTVVIYPLRALMVDQVAAALRRDPDRPYLEWHANLDVQQGVVVLQIERVDRDFLAWCQWLRGQGHLARIVLDEAHLVLTQSHFRECMLNVRPLLEASVPLVCLTATLPPSQEEEMRLSVGGPNWKVIRAPTQRPNLGLRIARYASKSDSLYALDLLLKRYNATTMPRTSGILIIVPSMALADELGKRYQIPVYHSTKDARKDRDVLNWVAGLFCVIVGTTGLGTGVDKDLCLMVIHFGLPYGMMSYWQECGRAGRKGDPAMCIMIWWGELREPTEDDHEGRVALNNMLMSTDCRRECISTYFDGSDAMTTCFYSMDLCDRCRIEMQREANRYGVGLNEPEIVDYGTGCMPRGVLPPRLLALEPPTMEYSQRERLVPASSPHFEPIALQPQTAQVGSDVDMSFNPEDPDDSMGSYPVAGSPMSQAPWSPPAQSPLASPTPAPVRVSRVSWSTPVVHHAHGKQRADQGPTTSPARQQWAFTGRVSSSIPHAESSKSAQIRASMGPTMLQPAAHIVSPVRPPPPLPVFEETNVSHGRSRSVSGPSLLPATVENHPWADPSTPAVVRTSGMTAALAGPGRSASASIQASTSALRRDAIGSSTAALARGSTTAAPYRSFVTALDVYNTPALAPAPVPGPTQQAPARPTAQRVKSVGTRIQSASGARGTSSFNRRSSMPVSHAVQNAAPAPLPAPDFAPGARNSIAQGGLPPRAPPVSPPSVPNYPRYRHPNGSPDNRRYPVQNPRALVANQLPPMYPIGSAVVRDGTNALHARHSERDPNLSDEEKHGSFAFPNLLTIQQEVMGWCMWCLVNRQPFTDHDLDQCRRYPYQKGEWGSPGGTLNGLTYLQSRQLIADKAMIPSDNTMCYFCYLPKKGPYNHAPGKTWRDCTRKHRLLPMAWFIMQVPQTRQMMFERFGIDESKSIPESFFKWLVTQDPNRKVTWRSYSTKFYYMWYVLLWLVIEVNEWRPPQGSLVGLD